MKPNILPFIISVLILFSQCKRNPCPDIPPDDYFYIKVGDSTLSKIPHTGLDTLIFYNQYGDTIFLKGTGKKTLTLLHNINRDASCGYTQHYSFDYKTLTYEQDPTLSNTSRTFPVKVIEIYADSNSDYKYLKGNLALPDPGGYHISFYQFSAHQDYSYLNDKHYTQSISIGNQIYYCVPFAGLPNGCSLYYNHYKGIVQVVESDTIKWNRKFN